ncbi:hypothetical protein [Mesorhizobium sp. DCY119]|uniref:hypothetical protein n=1 Tax=Mesorhizobium sp. DCY119 TaxID=2108445 RepID=UPI000E6B9857|nr:hypothetical protein [Mesorhizobium sp. DCY119]RJG46437.1 hypothetical protein D3Y55_20800 [Mesorhizobium sp. DCY119]
MYRLDPNPTFWAKVTVRPLGGGANEDFRVKFRALPASEYNAYDLNNPEQTRDFLVDTLEDVEDIQTLDGKSLAYSDAIRDQLIDLSHVRLAMVNAYHATFREALSGN